jgi:hypothetical protein
LLKRLEGPVELRYYSLLDPAGASDALKAFASRVDPILTSYEQESGGRLKVVRRNSQQDDSAAALADGLKPFNLDKGEPCYLGIVVKIGAQKELLPQLLPEWEQALEPDLTRAIARLLDASRPGTAMPLAPPSSKVIEEVKQAVPDFASLSLEEGTKTLRMTALNEFADAVDEMAAQVKAAQLRLSQAQNGGSEAEQQAAIKNLQAVQAAQTAKLQAIAARSKAQIQALRELKQSAK